MLLLLLMNITFVDHVFFKARDACGRMLKGYFFFFFFFFWATVARSSTSFV
jgi:hypothetical protein